MKPVWLIEWEDACVHHHGRLLKGKFGHYCQDFDGLPVDETVGEYQYCHCDKDSIAAANEAQAAEVPT